MIEDGRPYEHVGFIVLPALQLQVSGLHDDDPSQKAVNLFAKGLWGHLFPRMKPFHLPSTELCEWE